jgi:hypothetical protein
MTRYILFVFICLVFVACSSQNSFVNYIFNSTKDYQSLIQNTQKADIKDTNGGIKAFMIATYLNQTAKKWDDDVFHIAIGFYIVEDNSTDQYKLYINNYEDINQTKIDKNSTVYESLPIKNSWANYYMVEVAKTDINITITDDINITWTKQDQNLTTSIKYKQF